MYLSIYECAVTCVGEQKYSAYVSGSSQSSLFLPRHSEIDRIQSSSFTFTSYHYR